MSVLLPNFLYLLLLIPLLIGIYVWVLRRRRQFAVRYSSLALVREVAHSSWLRRHLPFILFVLALAGLTIAFARPVASVIVPSNRATVIMAIDVSRSMCSTDIPPNRLHAAKEAAKSFVRNYSEGRQIGIVAFAGFAEVIQPPTSEVSLLERAIDSLTPARRTAIGSAILRSLDAIAEIDSRIPPTDLGGDSTTTPQQEFEGGYAPHIIILLTDGSSNAGPYPLTAAEQAVDRGVRIYTIGFGTTNNRSPMICGDQFDNFDFGGGFGSPFGGGGGGFFRREIDEVTLRQIADLTGGEYYYATSADELENVFQSIPNYLVYTRETIEVGVFFTAFAALLILIAVILSLLWRPLA
ncbi:MAG TPA: VWA domain-containing protein [Anaerolineales bacterium]|nr:VWA domain-containing protein [Anaerolineales bacterium]